MEHEFTDALWLPFPIFQNNKRDKLVSFCDLFLWLELSAIYYNKSNPRLDYVPIRHLFNGVLALSQITSFDTCNAFQFRDRRR